MDERQRKVNRMSALIYLSISLAASLAFFIVAGAVGKDDPVARLGGAAWVLLLSMIVTMPLVIPWVKRRLGG